MRCANIVELLLTAAIAAFACLTWLSTRTYARLYGLGLLFEHFQKLFGPEDGAKRASIAAIRFIRSEYPDVYAVIADRLGVADKAKIEE